MASELKYVTETGLRKTLNNFLDKMRVWLPFAMGVSQSSTLIVTKKDSEGNDKYAEVALGQYNVSDVDTLFSIGNGSSEDHRSNAFEVKQGGQVLMGKNADYQEDTLFAIGNGPSEDHLSNAFEVKQDGDIFIWRDTDNDGIKDEKVNLQNVLESGGSNSITEDEIDDILKS